MNTLRPGFPFGEGKRLFLFEQKALVIRIRPTVDRRTLRGLFFFHFSLSLSLHFSLASWNHSLCALQLTSAGRERSEEERRRESVSLLVSRRIQRSATTQETRHRHHCGTVAAITTLVSRPLTLLTLLVISPPPLFQFHFLSLSVSLSLSLSRVENVSSHILSLEPA